MQIEFGDQSPEAKKEQLVSFLKQYSVPVETWTGEDTTKTVDDLAVEVEKGESTITINEAGDLIRETNVAAVKVFAEDPESGKVYTLREDYQQFADGSIRRRPGILGISEKIGLKENGVQGGVRGLKEELKITSRFEISTNVTEYSEDFPTTSYPGLKGKKNIFATVAKVDVSHFNTTKESGYQEVQTDDNGDLIKTIFFKWEEVEDQAEMTSLRNSLINPIKY